MTAVVKPVPSGTDRAPDAGEALAALFAAQQDEESPNTPAEKPDEAPAPEQPETPVEASGDAEAEEVATEDATPTEETAAPTLYTVVIDGKPEQVPLEELQAGYSRTGDYTRKTMAVAEERRKAEALARDASQERERYIEGLKNVEGLLAAQDGEEPDWDKLGQELDDAAFAKAHAQWDIRKQRIHTLRTKREGLEQKAFADREIAHQAYLREEQARLFAAIPEWKEPAKAQAEQNDITAYALQAGRDYGITEDALRAIDSAFPIITLRKAMLYDRMMAAKPKVVKQAVPTPTAKPGAKVVSTKKAPRTEAFERLVNTGDPKDAEAYFLQRIVDDEAQARR